MTKAPPLMPDSNRRTVLAFGAAGVVAMMTAGHARAAPSSGPAPGFTSVPISTRDAVVVPPEYEYQVLYRWGDPTGVAGDMPPFRPDASNPPHDQAVQAGMHHDGMHFFPIGDDGRRGLLVLNHEYTDERLLHTDGAPPWTAQKVRKSQYAMGVSVIEVAREGHGWHQVLPSQWARRIHGRTPMSIAGPAAGHPLLRTAGDPSGRRVLGTFANCAMGVTPWGTFLSCEENFHGYFGAERTGAANTDDAARRYGTVPGAQWVDWFRFDERFDLSRHPHEPHRFGWVVEIDPFDPATTPVKRTALGRKCTESATCRLTHDGRVAVYMGDDARFEYIYKFVSERRVRPGGLAANRDLLDHGTLHVARFDAHGEGVWLPLVHGQGKLTPEHGFADPAAVLVHARLAADTVGATKMDRPEWIAVHPDSGEVYASLTHNPLRGLSGQPGVDAANPRERNTGGHILRWREAAGDAAALHFSWDHFVLAGDPGLARSTSRYPSPTGDAFAAPDGLHFDASGLLWIQTDMGGQAMGKGDYAALGHNALLCADPASGVIRRFMTGPRGCEITGCVVTPDRSTLFVNIQHPGEGRDDAHGPATSAWPDGTAPGDARPRSAIIAVRRSDGGPVGS